MKESSALTLFRRLGVFAWIAAASTAAIAIAAAPASASDYSVAFQNCSAPTPPPLADTVPIAQIGGGNKASGGMFAGSPLGAEVRSTADAPNALVGDSKQCGAHVRVNVDDLIVEGAAPQAQVRLHLPFHANIHQQFTALRDLITNGEIASSTNQDMFFTATFNGPGFVVTGQLELQMNREQGFAVVITRPGNLEYVPRPRDPNAAKIDGSQGFVTLFFRNVIPATGPVGIPAAGAETFEIDELRGEMIITATVPTNQTLTLTLDLNISTNSSSFFISASSSAIDAAHLGVPTDGSVVFDLPDGFTAQSPSLGVVNNVVPPVFRCQKPMTFWRDHPTEWPVFGELQTLGLQTYNKPELFDLLNRFTGATRPDASLTLAQQLIAARLNILNGIELLHGSDPAPIQPTIDAANALLDGFAGRLPLGISPVTPVGRQMMQAAIALMNYNNQPLPGCVP